MGQSIQLHIGEFTLAGELNDSECATAVAEALPLEGDADQWGDELYFSIPVRGEFADQRRADFGVGELGFWPPGNAFCIFYGPTPASSDDQPMMASPGIPIGQITDDATVLRKLNGGTQVQVELT